MAGFEHAGFRLSRGLDETVYSYSFGVYSLTGRYRVSIAAGTAATASDTVTDLPVVIRVISLGHLETCL